MLLFLKVFFTEFIAEMGDKTQLMLIALTSKYKLKDIIMGTAALTPWRAWATTSSIFSHCAARSEGEAMGEDALVLTRMKRKKRAERARSNLLLWQCSVRSL